jgi:DNA polymerase-3 subunit epsilon
VRLARDTWGIYPTKLPDVCRKLRIPLKHHDAESDATACAKIAIAAIKDGYTLPSAAA